MNGVLRLTTRPQEPSRFASVDVTLRIALVSGRD
jgi:hypothetical protein